MTWPWPPYAVTVGHCMCSVRVHGAARLSRSQPLSTAADQKGAGSSSGQPLSRTAVPELRVEVKERPSLVYTGRYYPLLVRGRVSTACPARMPACRLDSPRLTAPRTAYACAQISRTIVPGQRQGTSLLGRLNPPRLSPKVDAVLREASRGATSRVGGLLLRGVAVEPMERDLTSLVVNGDGGAGDVWISSNTAKRGGVDMAREVSTVVNAANQCAVLGQPQPSDLQSRIARLKSSQRSFLNGLAVNRAKYTTYSRHFTSARVLRAVASRLQPELRAGDTFIDFACGQNSFGGMLTDPGTRGPLATRAFDVLSPAEKTADFERRNWLSVDASELPSGELVIGLNPPFGHQNKTAIEFVAHALCARPRLLVLIMPATNYQPPGYTLIHQDDQLCRGSVFYTPGSVSANWINANKQLPSFLLYRRRDELASGLAPRDCHCSHRRNFLQNLSSTKRIRARGLDPWHLPAACCLASYVMLSRGSGLRQYSPPSPNASLNPNPDPNPNPAPGPGKRQYNDTNARIVSQRLEEEAGRAGATMHN